MEADVVKLNKNKNLVSYSKGLAEARYSLNLMEQKLVWAMTSLISPNDEEFKTYKVEVKHLSEYIGIDKKSALRELDKITDSLMARVLRIPINNGEKLLKVHWVSHCVLDQKYIKFSFHGSMKPYLLQLKKHFTSHRYRILVSFRGSYTIRIYQLLKVYEYQGKYECSLEDFRMILDVGSAYKAFKEFKRNVINPAKREFESKNKDNGCFNSDITFDLETIRTGRSITHLRFKIKKQTYQEALPLDLPEPEEILPAILSLTKYGLSEPLARQLTDDKGEEYILRCVSLFEEAQKSGKVKNKGAGYLIKLIQAGAGNQTEAEKKAIEEEKKKAEAKREAKIQKKTEKEVTRLDAQYCKMARKDFLASLSEEEKENLLKALQEENPKSIGIITTLEAGYGGSLILNKIPNFYESKEAYIQKNL